MKIRRAAGAAPYLNGQYTLEIFGASLDRSPAHSKRRSERLASLVVQEVAGLLHQDFGVVIHVTVQLICVAPEHEERRLSGHEIA